MTQRLGRLVPAVCVTLAVCGVLASAIVSVPVAPAAGSDVERHPESSHPTRSGRVLPEIERYLEARSAEAEQIPSERRVILDEMAGEIVAQLRGGGGVSLVFVCTHNSRRSHMSQVWASASAARLGVGQVRTYSGGTEATAFNARAVAALQRAGVRIEKTTDDQNPVYHVRYTEQAPPLTCFSKEFAAAPNPRSGHVAVMVCSDADEACPVVPGAAARFALPYTDPKRSDGTPQETADYDDRCAQIAREQAYLWARVAGHE